MQAPDYTRSVVEQLRAAGRDAAEDVFATFDGTDHTFGATAVAVEEMARGLVDLGVQDGDRVLVLLATQVEALWAWFAVGAIGAIEAPVSEEATGASLRHVVDELEPRAVVTSRALLRRLRSCGSTRSPELVVVVEDLDASDEPEDAPDGTVVTLDEVRRRGRHGAPVPPPSLDATATIMFTSGSSGPPKGVMLSHGYYAAIAPDHASFYVLERSRVVYCPQPLCHIDARMHLLDVLALRGRYVGIRRFSVTRFWDDVEHYDAEVFSFIGAMLPLLVKQPVRPRPEHSRRGFGSAIPVALHAEFEERFNVELLEGYGMTEFPSVFCQRLGQGGPGSVGHPLPGVEVRVAHADGTAAASGETGELLLRPRHRHARMQGYWRHPEATVHAWRDLWFHTGDLVSELADGSYRYVGRLSDSIRRRGENVSAWEIEKVALSHPRVLEAAAIGVPSELGEEDVALVVVPHPDGPPDAEELRRHVAADLPRFAVPRYVDVVEALPKTPSERVAKDVLRRRGLSARVHDAGAGPTLR